MAMNNQELKNEAVESPVETTVFTGKLFKIVHAEQPDGRKFERAQRAPGVRLIISDRDNQRVLLTREFRQELGEYDFRLPGGKVFDSLAELDAWDEGGEDILNAAVAKAKGEGAEEAGVDISELELYRKSTLGATIEWDLFVFDVKQWQPHALGQQLEQGEDIDADSWFSFKEAEQMILDGKMQEERVALILLRWLHDQRKYEGVNNA
jgi:hypothetical protein